MDQPPGSAELNAATALLASVTAFMLAAKGAVAAYLALRGLVMARLVKTARYWRAVQARRARRERDRKSQGGKEWYQDTT
jgi:heme exporter protein D